MKTSCWTPEKRQRHSERAKARLADPAMREKISAGTRAGMVAAAVEAAPELAALETAWVGARPDVRRRFLARILSAVCGDANLAGDAR